MIAVWITLIDGIVVGEPIQVLPARVPDGVPRQEPARPRIVVAVRQAQQARLQVRVVALLTAEAYGVLLGRGWNGSGGKSTNIPTGMF